MSEQTIASFVHCREGLHESYKSRRLRFVGKSCVYLCLRHKVFYTVSVYWRSKTSTESSATMRLPYRRMTVGGRHVPRGPRQNDIKT